MGRNWPGAHAEWTRPARARPIQHPLLERCSRLPWVSNLKDDGRALTAARQLLPPDAVPSWSGKSKLENGGEVTAALEPDIESLESFGDHDGWPSQIHSIFVRIMPMRHHGGRGFFGRFPGPERSGAAKLPRTGFSSLHGASGRQADMMTRRVYRRNIPRRYYSVYSNSVPKAGSLLCNSQYPYLQSCCTPCGGEVHSFQGRRSRDDWSLGRQSEPSGRFRVHALLSPTCTSCRSSLRSNS